MPCSETSSSLVLSLDHDENFISFDYAKITCGREIDGGTGFSDYCSGKNLQQILDLSFEEITQSLELNEEESQFIFFLEWDALRSAIAQYLGIESETIDYERSRITSIEYTEKGIEVALVVLPPREMPKILPCSKLG